jgi:hypothetical protein
MATPTTDFTRLDEAAAQRGAMDMMQRKFLADQYANLANAPLPNQQQDPEGYQKALDQRAKALEMQQKIYSPDHHASLFDHIHSLITGRPVGAPAPAPPVSASAPAVPGQAAPMQEHLGTPVHPFAASHPVLGKIEEGIRALGAHLKAAATPAPAAPGPDFEAMAAAPTPEDTRRQEVAQAQANAIEVAKARNDKAVWKPFKLPDGSVQYFDASDPKSVPEGATAVVAGATPRLSQAALATYLRAKYGDNPTAEQIEEGTAAHQRLMAGITVGTHQALQFDDQGIPHVVTLESSSHKEFGGRATPESVKALADRFNSNKPSLDFRKATAAGTKAKETADAAESSYMDVQKASKDTTPLGDQGIILAWLRGRVNRVTQPEINSVNNLGGAQMKLEGGIVRIVSGKMTDQQRAWFLRSAKDNYETAKKIEGERTGPPSSSNAPSPPGAVHQYAIDDKGKRRKVLDLKAALPAGWSWAD